MNVSANRADGYTLFRNDLEQMLARLAPMFGQEFRSRRLFVTGGSSFFGLWLLESFLYANQRLNLGAKMTLLVRRPERFRTMAPHLAERPDVTVLAGDVRDFAFPDGDFSHVIHAATESDPAVYAADPQQVLRTAVDGTRRVLELTRRVPGAKLLFTSSGAVYGSQPPELTKLPETHSFSPLPPGSQGVYARGKRESEELCLLALAQYGLQVKIARGFAFTGAYLPLDRNFAVGNFVRDALPGGPIRVEGDGTPLRSYLYGADLAVWLWTILCQGVPGQAYNVGSDQAVSIADLARTVARAVPGVTVVIAGKPVPGAPLARYVPCVDRARRELGLDITVPLAEGVRRMVDWYASNQGATP